MADERPTRSERPDPAVREAELAKWLEFDPEPEPIPCDDEPYAARVDSILR